MRASLGRVGIVLFLFGATVGSALDAIHTYSGTTAYPQPVAFRMAWWTPLLFGFAGLSTGLAYPIVERLRRRPIAKDATLARVTGSFALFALLYLASGFLPASNAVKLAVLLAGDVALFATVAKTREALALAACAAVIGPATEIVLVAQGAFRHLQPDVFGIPIWLPALYAAGSFAIGLSGKALARSFEPRTITPSSAARSLP